MSGEILLPGMWNKRYAKSKSSQSQAGRTGQQRISTAVFAATEEREGVAFDIKIRLIADGA
jgi:hypothetical protein